MGFAPRSPRDRAGWTLTEMAIGDFRRCPTVRPIDTNSRIRLRGLFRAGTVRAAFPADFDGNGVANLVIGQPGIGVGNSPGTIHLYSTDSLSALDALNGAGDGLVSLSASDDLWGFAGESPRDSAGTRIAMGAFDQDGQADLVVAASNYDAVIENEGAVYAGGRRRASDLPHRGPMPPINRNEWQWIFLRTATHWRMARAYRAIPDPLEPEPTEIFSVESGSAMQSYCDQRRGERISVEPSAIEVPRR